LLPPLAVKDAVPPVLIVCEPGLIPTDCEAGLTVTVALCVTVPAELLAVMLYV
jgi:hypothetical protein